MVLFKSPFIVPNSKSWDIHGACYFSPVSPYASAVVKLRLVTLGSEPLYAELFRMVWRISTNGISKVVFIECVAPIWQFWGLS
jgi:hypothetical protein